MSEAVVSIRPPRLTFAGCCVWCGRSGCASAECVGLHEVSVWLVCAHCHGAGEGFRSEPKGCTCAFGLVLVGPVIERRCEVIPGRYQTAAGHWSQFNHKAYGVTSEPELVVVPPLRKAVAA